MHVPVAGQTGEAKFWIEPVIELARSQGFTQHQIRLIQEIVKEREDEIRDAWKKHFGG